MCSDHTYPTNYIIDVDLTMEDQEDDKIGDFVDTLNELIITCVQSYNHLYDKSVKNYKDNVMKNKSWEEIAKTCNISAEEVQERWKRLKTRYCRQRRLNEQATRSGSGIQTIKQWPLFESMKFMDKHIQRRRNFSNVSLRVGTKSEKNPSDELNFSHQNERGSTSAGQQSPNIAQFNQELKKVQSRSPESIKMESQVQNKFPEDQLEGSVHGLPRNWQNFEPSITNTLKTSTGVYQPVISLGCTSDISIGSTSSTPSTSTYENIDKSNNAAASSDRASDVSDYSQNDMLTVKEDIISHSAEKQVTAAKLSTTLIPFSPNIQTKCFSGGIQRKRKRNESDVVESSFVNTANVLKEYVLQKKEGNENYLPADEHFAKFIISRLSQLPEENRDEKCKKIMDVLLSK
ncbi:uncharacterized protein [Temnothorax longispinosus]|uniref:uncharacterized protein n=1 Tax=Temnothorax longispinosus TaxID=300112 RepID=UPI003A9A5828